MRVHLFERRFHLFHVGLVPDRLHLALVHVLEDRGDVDRKQEVRRSVLVDVDPQPTVLLFQSVRRL